MASRHRAARRADSRGVMIWPSVAGDGVLRPPRQPHPSSRSSRSGSPHGARTLHGDGRHHERSD
jgi:hypothetical protein